MAKSFKDLKVTNSLEQKEQKVVYEFSFEDEPEINNEIKDEEIQIKKDILDENIFLNLLKKSYQEDIKNKYEYNKTWISVGDIVKECPLQTIYRFLDNDYDIDTLSFYPYTKLITSVGSAMHAEIQNMLSKLYDNVEVEIRLEYEPLNVKGFIDLKYEVDNTLVLGEIKTISIDELNDPNFQGRETHWKQITMYSFLYEKMFNRQPDFIQLIYVIRDFKPTKTDNGKIEPFKIFTAIPEVLYDRYLQDILDNLDIIRSALKNKKIPSKLPKDKKEKIKKANECFFCPYKHKCNIFTIRKRAKEIKIML